jgi:transposase
LVEVADIHRFPSFAHFNSFVGFCPGEHSSGEEERKGHIISRHHQTLRMLLIEAAWMAVKNDPALTLAYSELKKKMTGKQAIIRIARKLLNRIYHVWKKKEAYEKGIIK